MNARDVINARCRVAREFAAETRTVLQRALPRAADTLRDVEAPDTEVDAW